MPRMGLIQVELPEGRERGMDYGVTNTLVGLETVLEGLE